MANKTDQTDIRKYFAAGTRSVVLHIFIPLTNISIRRNKLGLKQFLNLPPRNEYTGTGYDRSADYTTYRSL